MPTDRLWLPDHGPADRWSRRRFLGTSAAGLAAAALAGCSLEKASSRDTSRDPSIEASDWAGEIVDPGLERPDVTFTDMDGEPFPFREKTEGKLSILFFGYTNCPDVCPIFLTSIARAIESIATGPGSDPQVLFVGVDVARDTPEQMRTYLGRINPTFVGLTGSEEVIAQANREVFNPPIEIEEADAEGEYLVGHASRVFPFTADGLAHRTYPSDTRQQAWAKDLPRLAEGRYA
jgi:protein SCO1/2